MISLYQRIKAVFEPGPPQHGIKINMPADELNRRIILTQLGQMKYRSSAVVLARMFFFIIFAAMTWQWNGGWLMVCWLAFAFMHAMAGMKSTDDFFNSPNPEKELKFWVQRSLQMVFVSGMTIGFSAFAFFVPDEPIEQMMLTAMLMAVTLGSVTLYASWLPAYWTFLPTVLLPVLIKIMLVYDLSLWTMVMWTVVFLIVFYYYSVRLNTIYTQSIYRTLEREVLIEELVQQRQRADLAKAAAEISVQSKTNFFAAANHDLRQPLQAMGIFISLLHSQVSDPLKPMVDNLSKACTSVSTLVDQILIISKLEANNMKKHPENFPLSDLFEELEIEFSPLAESKGLTFKLICPDVSLYTDRQLLSRVLRNLLGNALRYTKEGTILLRGKKTKQDTVILTVSDTGCGIDKEDRQSIFKEYFRGKGGCQAKEGYGLGLSIVRRLVDFLGIKMSLYSRAGKGTIFRLDMPIATGTESEVKSQVHSSGKQMVSLKNVRILFIEDEPLIRKSVQTLLEAWGAHVTVTDGFSTQLSAEIATTDSIDLILTDFNLGLGKLTGLQSIFRLRSAVGRRIPAIVMTATARETVMSQYEEETEGLDYAEYGSDLMAMPVILQKPVSPNDINRAISRLLDLYESRDNP